MSEYDEIDTSRNLKKYLGDKVKSNYVFPAVLLTAVLIIFFIKVK